MPRRAEEIADDLVAATEEALNFGEALDDAGWAAQPCGGDERSVAQVFHHMAVWMRTGIEWMDSAVAGTPVEVTPDDQKLMNERDAAALPEPEREETLLLLRELRDETVRHIRELSDEELDRKVHWTGPNQDWSAAQFAGMAATHVRRHLADVKAALG